MDVKFQMIDEDCNEFFYIYIFPHSKQVKDNNAKNCNIVVRDK